MILSALIASLLLPPPQTAPQKPASSLPDVVVEGRVLEGEVLEDLARDFIGEVTAAPRGATVARWNGELCIAAVNLPTDAAQFLVDRVAKVAVDVGVEPEAPGCSPDLIIVATRDGAAVARGLVERRGRILAPGNAIQSLSRRELEAFAEGDRPVRWWHLSTAVDPVSGRSVVRDPRNENFDPNDVVAFLQDGPVLSTNGTLIGASTRQHLRRVLVIIDFDLLGEVTFEQLADYVAFVGLAQVDAQGDTASFATILNVFDDPSATSGLTDWDRAYLRGLYQSRDDARNDAAREGAIRREMLRAREQGQGAETD